MTTEQLMAGYDSATPDQHKAFPSLKLPRADVIRLLEKYEVYSKHYASK